MVDNDYGFTQYPLVPGHEAVGVVAAVGHEVAHQGGFATHVRVENWQFAFPLPDEIHSEHAGPLMCAGADSSLQSVEDVYLGERQMDRTLRGRRTRGDKEH